MTEDTGQEGSITPGQQVLDQLASSLLDQEHEGEPAQVMQMLKAGTEHVQSIDQRRPQLVEIGNQTMFVGITERGQYGSLAHLVVVYKGEGGHWQVRKQWVPWNNGLQWSVGREAVPGKHALSIVTDLSDEKVSRDHCRIIVDPVPSSTSEFLFRVVDNSTNGTMVRMPRQLTTADLASIARASDEVEA